MGTRNDFGFNWSDVIVNWYLGKSPQIPGDTGWEALGALERLWPEYIDKILSEGQKGLAVMAPVINLGITLAVCKNLVGFDEVLRRMKQDERAAFSEAFFAAKLVKIGYVPVFEPELHGKRLDALVNVQDKKVYIEIITPEQSEMMKRNYAGMNDLAKRLIEQNPGTSIDIYLLVDPTSDVLDTILNFVKEVTDSQYNTTLEIPNIAFLRYVPYRLQEQPLPFEPIANTSDPVLLVMTFSMREGVKSRTVIHIPFTDKRAKRLMSDEADHFSPQEMNLLVMDVSSIPDGIRRWTPLIQRCVQPNRNKRFGAVVLFFCYFQDATIKTRLRVLRNPYAYRPIPERLLDDIMSLNDSSA